jgi:hypothetical protein
LHSRRSSTTESAPKLAYLYDTILAQRGVALRISRAADNWSFLSPLTDHQLVDFYHASEYVGKASLVMFGPKQLKEREAWLADRLHRLKHNQGAATRLWKEMEEFAASHTIRSQSLREGLESAVTYFGNQKHRMHYGYHTARHQPIGSGVTEAACKVLIKQRFCRSGSRWKEQGAAAVLSIRDHWRATRPVTWLFPSSDPTKPLQPSTITRACRQAAQTTPIVPPRSAVQLNRILSALPPARSTRRIRLSVGGRAERIQGVFKRRAHVDFERRATGRRCRAE